MTELSKTTEEDKPVYTESQLLQEIESALTLERSNAQLTAASQLDGRYNRETREVVPFVSEHALMRYRSIVEIKWLQFLLSGEVTDKIPAAAPEALARLSAVLDDYSLEDTAAIKEHERVTKHDVKALEYWLKDEIGNDPELGGYLEYIHLGATSEDLNNLAYAMMLSDLRSEVFVPHLRTIQTKLGSQAVKWADIPSLGLTHGQAASPTTIGKEIRVTERRLDGQIEAIEAIKIKGKFNGATGNFNALQLIDPTVDWPAQAKKFVESLGDFTYNGYTTQIEPLDWFIDFANHMSHADDILQGFAQDTWMQIMLENFGQIPEAGATGSSTMPHKVNPIRFENSEGRLAIASNNWTFLAHRLAHSRLQRDLSGSTVLRHIGDTAGSQLIGYKSLEAGLEQIYPNEIHLEKKLADSPQVLAEAIQTMMRVNLVPNSYDVIKEITRGANITQEELALHINNLSISEEDKQTLINLTPAGYTGVASKIATMQLGLEDEK
jgi:adenylosuccinate lyase